MITKIKKYDWKYLVILPVIFFLNTNYYFFAILACTEEYNGTSWSAGGALITARNALAGAGTQNEGLAFGGANTCTNTEEYNGTTWSAGGALALGRYGSASAGTQNAALVAGGGGGTSVEEYNGTSWSSAAAGPAVRFSSGGGSQLAAFVTGGSGASAQLFVSSTDEYTKTFTIIDTCL